MVKSCRRARGLNPFTLNSMPSSVSESASWWRASTRSPASHVALHGFPERRALPPAALAPHLNQQCPRVFHYLLAMVTFLNLSITLGLVRVTPVYVTVPPSGRSAPSFRDPQETRDLPPRRSGVLHAPPHWKQSKMPKVGTSKATELVDRAEEGG